MSAITSKKGPSLWTYLSTRLKEKALLFGREYHLFILLFIDYLETIWINRYLNYSNLYGCNLFPALSRDLLRFRKHTFFHPEDYCSRGS